MYEYTYDIETFRAQFLLSVKLRQGGARWRFEVSRRRNESNEMIAFLRSLETFRDQVRMVGFNNLFFDWPVLKFLMTQPGFTAQTAYEYAQFIIRGDRFANLDWNPSIPQLDLYKIHHFDNPAKSTSLKALEFNMRSDRVMEIPVDIHAADLTDAAMEAAIWYNDYDVDQTEKFFIESLPLVEFRDQLNADLNVDWTNSNDTKIGKDYLIRELEARQPGLCYTRSNGRREPRQTPRDDGIWLKDVILPAITFAYPEFNEIVNDLRSRHIYETKNAFSLEAIVKGFKFKFGTGGLHGSVLRRAVRADDDCEVVDIDVKSFYPNIAIQNRLYPAHLGEVFCDIYGDLYVMRGKYPKSNPINGVLKLGLNGVYGDSNNYYSPFLDPFYTMQITINGQLLLCMLAELIFRYTDGELIQANTDGLTVRIPRTQRATLDQCCKVWEDYTKLTLEYADYDVMFIRDVNNYIARYTDGKMKRKGAYETKQPGDRAPLGWHQDCGGLVIPKIAEKVMMENADLRSTLINWADPYDFALRVKVNRASRLVGESGKEYERLTRYYIARVGDRLYKEMNGRRSAIEKGWYINGCNDMRTFDWNNLELQWYAFETEKMVIT